MTVTISVSHRTGDMHLLLIIIAGVIIAHWIMGKSNGPGFGCLFLIIVLLLLGALASH